MFTDRFIKVPISTYNVREKELTGNETLEENWFKFLPFELAGYRPAYGDDEEVENTLFILKCGDSTLTTLTPAEFEKLLNDHDKE